MLITLTRHPSMARLDAFPLTPDMTLNEITVVVPGALEVFHQHKLDACCGGAKPLALVCERHGLDLDAVMAELREHAAATR